MQFNCCSEPDHLKMHRTIIHLPRLYSSPMHPLSIDATCPVSPNAGDYRHLATINSVCRFVSYNLAYKASWPQPLYVLSLNPCTPSSLGIHYEYPPTYNNGPK